MSSAAICVRETGIKVTEEGGHVLVLIGDKNITLSSEQAHLLADALREVATVASLASRTTTAVTKVGPDPMPKVFTPETLAKRWGCSEQHIRNLVARNELGAFRVGGKLLRIPADAVDEYERQNTLPVVGAPEAAPPPPAPKARARSEPMDPVTRIKLQRLREGWKSD